MKIMNFKIRVAVPDYLEDITKEDFFDLFDQQGDARSDLRECAWEITKLEDCDINEAKNEQ